MTDRILSTPNMILAQRALDASALQHRVLSDNIANVDTPGFKRSEVVFREKLKKVLDQQRDASNELKASRTDTKHFDFRDEAHIDSIRPELQLQNNTSLRNDQNNVDIDLEMAKLAQNTVVYQTLVQIVQNQLSGLRGAINEGRK